MNAITIKKPVATTGEIRWYGASQVRFLLNPEETEGDFAIVEMTSLAGAEPPAHVHLHEDETFLLHEGEIRFFIGDQVIDAKPGMTVFAPRGIRHAYKITTPAARFTLFVTPGDFVNFFRERSTDTPPAGPIVPPTPGEFSELSKILAQQYGVHFTGNSL